MLSIYEKPTTLCDSINRRELLRIGGLGLTGMSLPLLLAKQNVLGAPSPNSTMFGRAKNVIFLYLAGGPPQHETFDPKPNAPTEVRGEFQPISTNVAGIQFCELLPRTARIADKLAICRSMSTDDNTHSSSSHWVLTGYKYQGPNPRTIQPSDWPYFGSIIKRYKPSETLAPLSTVWLPDVMRLNENVTPAGQTGGRMGRQWDPELFVGDPSHPNYRIEGLEPRGIPPLRIEKRQTLLKQLQDHFQSAHTASSVRLLNSYQQQAFDLMTSGKAQQAFAIQQEPAHVRERYGRNRWGQCVLLARRLIEAGVRLVHVQWPREDGDNAVDNPLWDTHAQNFDRVEDVLCPMFDVGYSALIEDLEERGLLDETLVVAIGEFGRTPKINPKAGRDHWGSVFSFALAGAGIRGGQVYGSSDAEGAYPKSHRVEPGNLTATMFHLLGLDHRETFTDPEGRELALTGRAPLYELLGESNPELLLRAASGKVSRVPPYDPTRFLVNTKFSDPDILRPLESPSRPKGWRAAPLVTTETTDHSGVWQVARDETSYVAEPHLAMGFNLQTGKSQLNFASGIQALLAQEVRSPFSGSFRFRVHAIGDGSSRAFYEDFFAQHFTCRIVFFEFTERSKKADQRREWISSTIQPRFIDHANPRFETFDLQKQFVPNNPGENFSFGLGLGVGILLEQNSGSNLELPASLDPQQALIRIARVELAFLGKEVIDNVTV